MREFFFSEKNPFVSFSTEHQLVFLAFIFSTIAIILIARNMLTYRQQTLLGTFLGLLTLFAVLLRMLIISATKGFSIQEELPLYICRIVTFVVPFMMYYRHRKSFGLLYYIILAGTLNALITPDLEFGFPHYSAFLYWLLHAGLVMLVLYAVFVYRLRPTLKDLWHTFIVINFYLVLLHGINLLIGANYSYTVNKPPGPSLLDAMGQWPWYLLSGQAVALLLFFLLYMPFWVQKKKPQAISK